MDLSLHRPRWPFSLEKWYLDVLLDDGTVLLVYLGAMRLFGVSMARVTAELFAPGSSPIQGNARVEHIEGSENRLQFGPAMLEGERLTFQTAGLSGELTITPRAAPVALREPFLSGPSGSLHWSVEVPDADAVGRVWWRGGERAIVGRSYRDRVWFDIAPWRFPIRELLWGRAIAGSHAATWVRASTAAGAIGASWLDGQLGEDLGGQLSLGEGRAFVETKVADLPGLLLGPARPLLRRLTRDPHEVKYVAPATLAGHSGMAVHEVVRWR